MDILTDEEPALMERIILDILGSLVGSIGELIEGREVEVYGWVYGFVFSDV
jgi:hypothetical protein